MGDRHNLLSCHLNFSCAFRPHHRPLVSLVPQSPTPMIRLVGVIEAARVLYQLPMLLMHFQCTQPWISALKCVPKVRRSDGLSRHCLRRLSLIDVAVESESNDFVETKSCFQAIQVHFQWELRPRVPRDMYGVLRCACSCLRRASMVIFRLMSRIRSRAAAPSTPPFSPCPCLGFSLQRCFPA